VHVDRAPVDLAVRLQFVHLREQRAVGAVLQFVAHPVHVAQAEVAGGVDAARPEELPRFLPQLLRREEHRHDLPQIREERDIVRREGEFRGGGPHVGELDEEVVRIDDGAFALPREEPLRVDREVLVQRQVVQQQKDGGLRPLPPGAPRLLPEGGARSGEAHQHGRVQPPDVDAQLKHVGRHKPAQFAARHLVLDGAPFQRRVAAPVAGDQVGEVLSRERAPLGLQVVAGLLQHHLHRVARLAERQEAGFPQDELRDEPRRLPRRGDSEPSSPDERRLPHVVALLRGGRAVLRDQREGRAADLLRKLDGVRDRRGAAQKARRGAVVAANSGEPLHQVGEVRSERASVGVQLVHHDVLQVREQEVKAERAVVRQKGRVQHLRVGQDDVRAAADAASLVRRRVAVVDSRLDAPLAEMFQQGR
jgi:hypothetical protein